MVLLLDLHTNSSQSARGPPSLEILEAGTGHGALTLYLARAIDAGNTGSPRWNDAQSEGNDGEDGRLTSTDVLLGGEANAHADNDRDNAGTTAQSIYEHKHDRRRAVIHTIDVSRRLSKHARQMIKGFRQGMYRRNIKFHLGDVSLGSTSKSFSPA